MMEAGWYTGYAIGPLARYSVHAAQAFLGTSGAGFGARHAATRMPAKTITLNMTSFQPDCMPSVSSVSVILGSHIRTGTQQPARIPRNHTRLSRFTSAATSS